MDYSRLFSLFLFLTIVQSQDSEKSTDDLVCQVGWLLHKDQCYFIRGGYVNLTSAHRSCSSLDSELAEVKESDTLDFLYQEVHAACEDRDRKCPEFADAGQCWKPGFHDWMRENCRFSCGLCISLCRNDPDYHQMCVSTVKTSGWLALDQYDQFNHCTQACGCGGFSDDFWIQPLENPKNPGAKTQFVAGLENVSPCDPQSDVLNVQLDTVEPMVKNIRCAYPGTFTAGYICETAAVTADQLRVGPSYIGCPVDSVGYENKCYIYDDQSSEWSDANKECQHVNGVLASLPNRELAEKLMAELPWLDHLVWLGLSLEGDGPYRWLNQRRVQYLPWGERTDQSGYACVLMDLSRDEPYLKQAACGFMRSSVCEIPRHGYPQESPQEDTRLEVDLAECHRPWVAHGEFCYQLFTEEETWADAEKSCQDVQGSLVSLHSRADLDWINTLLSSAGDSESAVTDAWIGLHPLKERKAYAWTDGSPFDFNIRGMMWALEAEGAEKCVKVQNTSWLYIECDTELPYICQIPRELFVKTPTEAPTITTTAAAKTPPAVDDDVESREDVDKQPEVIKTEPVPVDDQDPADIRGDQDPADVRGNAQGSAGDCNCSKSGSIFSNWQVLAIVIAAVAFIAILSFVIVAVSGLRRRSGSTSAPTVRGTKSVTYANTMYNAWDTPPLPPPPPRDAEAAGEVEVEDDASISPYDIPRSGRSSLASSTRRLVHERDEDIIPVVGFENAIYGVASSRRRDH